MKLDSNLLEDFDWEEEEAVKFFPRIKGLPQKHIASSDRNKSRRLSKHDEDVYAQSDDLRSYDFTYAASRHEAWWLLDSLGPFYDEQWFDDVLQMVKGGKEASVYLCKGNPSTGTRFLAAKVYRPRSLRNLRKDHIYREGRAQLDADGLEIFDDRQNRAILRRTAYGQELMHTSWIEHEFKTLQILHEAGCDVPAPYASDHNAILMDFIGDIRAGAPTLNGINLDRNNALRIFDQVIQNVDLMLSHDRIHGDLSAYNILFWQNEITLIDFPQAINPKQNPNAYPIFLRDITRICDYFSHQGVDPDPENLAEDLWTTHDFSIEPNILWNETAGLEPFDYDTSTDK